MSEHELDPGKPLVLLFGHVAHEGIVSALSAAARQYKQKYPESEIRNWPSILRYFDQFPVAGVIWKISPATYHVLTSPGYAKVRDKLLTHVASTPHILFVHEDLFSGRDDGPWAGDFPRPTPEVRQRVHDIFQRYRLQVLPYRRNAELTVMAAEFIASTEQGLLLRIYVPAGRMWAQETDRLLALFREYLSRVSQLSIRLDQVRTGRGTIYEFHGEDSKQTADLSSQFQEFSRFLDLCVSHPEQAEALLNARDLPRREIGEILTRYSKEARRLTVDLKHERERKLLGIRQRLESELTDVAASPSSLAAIEALIEATVPRVLGIGSAASIDQSPLQVQGGHVTVNLGPQIIQAAGGIIAQEIRGDIHLAQQDQELLALIQQYGGAESASLASAVHEVSDPGAPAPGRLVAKQRLKKFLIAVSSKAGDVATGILQRYIESKLGL